MAKVQEVERDGQLVGYYFDCPGCKSGHLLYIKRNEDGTGPCWTFNGDVNSPTFNPSVMTRWSYTVDCERREMVCHSFVRDGHIQFLNDCSHSLAGQTVPMFEVETDE